MGLGKREEQAKELLSSWEISYTNEFIERTNF